MIRSARIVVLCILMVVSWASALEAQTSPSCYCTMLIRYNAGTGAWEKDDCGSTPQCLWGEGACEEMVLSGYFYCGCVMSEDPEHWPGACFCTAAVNAAKNPPILCVERHKCTDSGIGSKCDTSHWIFPWGTWTEACRCN